MDRTTVVALTLLALLPAFGKIQTFWLLWAFGTTLSLTRSLLFRRASIARSVTPTIWSLAIGSQGKFSQNLSVPPTDNWGGGGTAGQGFLVVAETCWCLVRTEFECLRVNHVSLFKSY